jgi:restriction endonuclease
MIKRRFKKRIQQLRKNHHLKIRQHQKKYKELKSKWKLIQFGKQINILNWDMEILQLCIKKTFQEDKSCWEQIQTKFGLMGQEQEISGQLKLQITKMHERLAFLQSTNKERSATLDMLGICCSATHTTRHLHI